MDSEIEMYRPEAQANAPIITGHIAHTHHGFIRKECCDVDGVAVVDGDIVLGPTEHMHNIEALAKKHGIDHFNSIPLAELPGELYDAIGTFPITGGGPIPKKLYGLGTVWTNRIIYYKIDQSPLTKEFYWQSEKTRNSGATLTPEQIKKTPNWVSEARFNSQDLWHIREAIDAWESFGFFKFVDWKLSKAKELSYITFKNGGFMEGHHARFGMFRGESEIYLEHSYLHQFSAGIAMHEIGHAIGLLHEQQRLDTRSYIQINWANIKGERLQNQFKHYGQGYDQGPYNYASIMQYPARKPVTMVAFNPNAILGQRRGLSIGDINASISMYAEKIPFVEIEMDCNWDNSEDGIVLCMGGREFYVDQVGKSKEGRAICRLGLSFGQDGAVANAESNDPRSPQIFLPALLNMPMYIKSESMHPIKVNQFTVRVFVKEMHSDANGFPALEFSIGARKRLVLSRDSGQAIYLEHQIEATQYIPESFKVNQIEVEVVTGKLKNSLNLVYLVIGGREFRLYKLEDDYQNNTKFTFKLGSGGNVKFPFLNDPASSEMTTLDIERFPMYLRSMADWSLESASITVKSDGKDIKLTSAHSSTLYANKYSTNYWLKYEQAPSKVFPKSFTRLVSQISVHIDIGEISGKMDGTTTLTIGGRDFCLNSIYGQFTKNNKATFTFGNSEDDAVFVLNSDKNDPTNPQLTELDLNTYPAFLQITWGTLKLKNLEVYVRLCKENGDPAGQAIFSVKSSTLHYDMTGLKMGGGVNRCYLVRTK